VSAGSEPAFPVAHVRGEGRDGDMFVTTDVEPGLTKRELFAALAMQGMLSDEGESSWSSGSCATRAVSFADALIQALVKQP
jgi:hypothetical protein